jgi:hypothetical protein
VLSATENEESGAQKPRAQRNYSTHHYEDVRNITHCQRNLRDFEHRQRRQNAIIVRSPSAQLDETLLSRRVNVDASLPKNKFVSFFLP